jgi:hypothetical protein
MGPATSISIESCWRSGSASLVDRHHPLLLPGADARVPARRSGSRWVGNFATPASQLLHVARTDCMFRGVPPVRNLQPGHTFVYPNREKAASKATRAIVVLILLISVALMLIVTIGGWSKLEGLKAVNFAWCIIYAIIAFYVATRWARGLLPIAAAIAMLLLILAVIAGLGVSGTSWFDRSHTGFAAPQTLFGGKGLDPDFLGLVTLLIALVQALLIVFAMRGFAQGWNVEVEIPIEEADRRGNRMATPPTPPSPPKPAAA